MNTSISIPAKSSGKILLQKGLIISGILSSLLYVAMNIFVPLRYPDYNSASQTISELSAIDAPTRSLWAVPGFIYTLMVTAFGLGVIQTAGENRKLNIAGILLMIYGIIGFGWPLAPMHQREVLAAGGGTISDTLHIVYSMVTVSLMLLAMGFGAAAFGKNFRIYSIVTILLLLVLGILTGIDAPKLEKNLPTPLIGVWERIMIGIFLAWIIVLAVMLLRRIKNTDSRD